MFKQLRTVQLNVPVLGNLGHLTVFLWALGMILTPPLAKGIFPALIAIGALIALYPFALQRMIRLRWVLILVSLFLVNLFFSIPEEGPDWVVWDLPLSSLAALTGLQMVLRAIVILLAANGLSVSVDIIEMASLLERGGLYGLGFSIGVATNLLPDLRQSGTNAWHSLRMRGGLRFHWWRGIQLLVLTVLTNALRHTEGIVLAAEVRAFRPEMSRKVSLHVGSLDGWVVGLGLLSLILVNLIF